jgi:hypothetical protein
MNKRSVFEVNTRGNWLEVKDWWTCVFREVTNRWKWLGWRQKVEESDCVKVMEESIGKWVCEPLMKIDVFEVNIKRKWVSECLKNDECRGQKSWVLVSKSMRNDCWGQKSRRGENVKRNSPLNNQGRNGDSIWWVTCGLWGRYYSYVCVCLWKRKKKMYVKWWKQIDAR